MPGTVQTTPRLANTLDMHDIVVAMLDSADGIEGETAIQKIAYLIKTVHPHLAIPEFEPQYFGPFSLEVGTALSGLRAFGFVGTWNVAGCDCTYRLAENGRVHAADLRRQHRDTYDMIRTLTAKCLELSCRSTRSLSFAAKMRDVYVRDGPMTERNVLRLGADLGWLGLTENEMRNALNLLRVLGLDQGAGAR